MDKINKFDLSKYNLRGEELLASATVTGLYAMQADGADCPHCDFGSLVEGVEGKQVTINAPAAKEIIRFIYERFVEGDTYSAISKQLEEKGARRLRSDKPFSASAIIRFTDTFSAPSAGPLSKGVRSRIPVAITRHGTAPRGRRGRTGTAAGTWSGKRRSSPMRSVDSLDIECGINAGTRTVLLNGEGTESASLDGSKMVDCERQTEFTAPDLLTAVKMILNL